MAHEHTGGRQNAGVRFLLAAAAFVLLAGACGGGSGSEDAGGPAAIVGSVETTAAPGGAALPEWVETELRRREGADVGLTLSTSDFAPGPNRIGFLIVRSNGELVQAPGAEVYVARAGAPEPLETEAKLVTLLPHSHEEESAHDHVDATDLYVAEVDLPEPGRYWLVVDPEGESIQGVGTLDVDETSASPAIGTRAPASENPTLADAPAAEISTASPPSPALLRHSVAESLEEGVPFVVVFATPKFCESRTCGPTVETVEVVQKELGAGSGVRFIHIEIFEDNDPGKGTNRWVREWNLPTEPWVFLVDGGGIVRAKFEGSLSADELEQAIRSELM